MNEENLSPREYEVIQLISWEYSTIEIAQQLFLSPETIKSHRKNIIKKLNVKNSAGIVRRAFELDLISVQEKF